MDPFFQATIGEYRITALLGQGGMGRVYRAHHHRLGRDAAVKVLTAAANDPVFLQRFLNEAQIQSRLRHPGIASLYDFTEFQGVPVMIMELIDGETLQEMTRRMGSWPAEQAIPALTECARTLEYVHSQGILHRDLKSANVKISSSGEVKLLDFGIAIPSGGAGHRLTTTGFVIGTLETLAPEQLRGEQASPASDIWAFGVLAYEMVTGSLPFGPTNPAELLGRIARVQFTSPRVLKPAIPKALDGIICRCLKSDPKARYLSFTELRADLEKLKAHSPSITSQPATPTGPAGISWTSWALIAGLVIVLLGGVFGAFQYTRGNTGQGDPLPATADSPRTLPTADIAVPGTLSQTPASPATPAGSDLKHVTVDVFDGSAEVWENGRKLGTTPYTVREPNGRSVQLTLRQPGFRDTPVQFDVGERTSYSYEMERSSPQ